MSKHWTAEDDAILRARYLTTSAKELEKELGHPEKYLALGGNTWLSEQLERATVKKKAKKGAA